jgi:murein DD-endopeptidase MepM/ murein hydrolase activator NlpD
MRGKRGAPAKRGRTLAPLASGGLVLAIIVAGVLFLGNGPTSVASDPVEGKAKLAVESARNKQKAKRASAEEKALQMVRLRSQVEESEKERKRKQDEAHARRMARKAAEARKSALNEVGAKSRRERASRDAERARLEAERKKYEGTPQEVARNLLPDHGWDLDQWPCLDKLWTRESRWKWDADNPTSSAYGIPQALPGRRMAEYGDDWRTNPVTQIRWGLDYIQDAYGSPCEAWAHSEAKGWY